MCFIALFFLRTSAEKQTFSLMDVGVGFVENILLRHVGVIETPALLKCSKQKQHSECTAKQQIAKKIKWKTVMITRFKKIRLIFPIEWRCYDLLSNYG